MEEIRVCKEKKTSRGKNYHKYCLRNNQYDFQQYNIFFKERNRQRIRIKIKLEYEIEKKSEILRKKKDKKQEVKHKEIGGLV